jgi:undecaprenyl diphosphate synthase
MIVPQHIGFIMDGNGRWARKRGLPRSAGHRAGIEHIREVLRVCNDLGVKIASFYVWSTENWTRPLAEVRHLMHCLWTSGPKLAQELHAQNVRIMHSGSRQNLSKRVLRVIDDAVELTQENGPRVVNLIFNSSGRTELLHAIRQLVTQRIEPEAITEATISEHLFSAGLPDVDLVIRSGGDQRLSNFMLWQSAYAWIYITQAYWPALSRGDIEAAIEYYNWGLARQKDLAEL